MGSANYAPRVAGFAFLFLIATGLCGAVMWAGVRTTHGISDTLISISENSFKLRIGLVLNVVAGITTLVLAAMLYAIVAHRDQNLAALALACRAVEAGLSAVGMLTTLALLAMSQGHLNAGTGDASSVHVLAALFMNVRPMVGNIAAIFFAVGSTLYCLLWRARSIPVPLSMLGLMGSLLVLVGVPVQTAFSHPTFVGASAVIWAPLAVFEVAAGGWLLLKGTR